MLLVSMESRSIFNITNCRRKEIRCSKTIDFDKQAVYRPDNIVLQSTLNYVTANLTELAILVIRFSGEDLLMAGVRPLMFSSTFFDYL